MKSIYKNYRWKEVLFLIFISLLLIYVAVSLVIKTGWSWIFDSNAISNYGSSLSGVATIISVYYLYKTLREQGRQFQIQNFEGRYFELIRFNRNTIDSMTCIDTSKDIETKLNGEALLEFLQNQIEEAIKIVEDFIKGISIEDLYQTTEKYQVDKAIWEDKLERRSIINIAFLITFFGIKNNEYKLLKNKYLLHYKEEKIEELLKEFQLKLSASQKISSSKNPVENAKIMSNENKYFAGFQHEVGNYFRSLFQCIKYVNKQTFLSYQEKYEYVKILRCQMSNAEEMVLFYDTISDLGIAWEYKKESKKNINNQLITKYNLIKNIPITNKSDAPILFYPNVSFEDITNTSERKKIENQYE